MVVVSAPEVFLIAFFSDKKQFFFPQVERIINDEERKSMCFPTQTPLSFSQKKIKAQKSSQDFCVKLQKRPLIWVIFHEQCKKQNQKNQKDEKKKKKKYFFFLFWMMRTAKEGGREEQGGGGGKREIDLQKEKGRLKGGWKREDEKGWGGSRKVSKNIQKHPKTKTSKNVHV